MKKLKFYYCKECGSLNISFNNVNSSCCNCNMEELVANTVEASREKHLPVYEIKDNVLDVCVGSVIHPMIDAHYIEWICVETLKGYQVKYLKPNEEPKVSFMFSNDTPVSVYAYCNLHGLWKVEVK